ncbi:MAG: nucleoside triphosphate pyrophosphohydrolase [Hallerella porci]|nr:MULTISPECIES: nucleoside triphosphate pyrophosphohydrolase [Hallerella]MCI5599880.1 nucleoside triphosphate pyrophosphohydrolase [Hallerella sp.]MDY3920629.1 nucleoside triphosphate pyrophosphohydrolase [Hallerella porci]
MKYSFEDLIRIMKQLRSENGCPWDRKQTTQTLLPYLVEESSEFIDAAQDHDTAHMCEELGDVLFQVVFHSQVTAENGDFTIDDVTDGICRKMIRRHPHVFGDAHVKNAGEVSKRWEEIKAKEANNLKLQGMSAMDKVAHSMPTLSRAQDMGRRAAKCGFDWKDNESVLQKVREEWNEFLAEYEKHSEKSPNLDRMEDELGDVLFTLCHLARHLGLNAETALIRANNKFDKRFRSLEKLAKEKQPEKSLGENSPEELLALWQKAKNETSQR